MWLFIIDTGIDPKTGKRQQAKRRGFKTKKEAQQAVLELEQQLANGYSLNYNNLTYKDVYDQWFSTHVQTIKMSTQKSINSKFSKHILPRFGQLKIKDITKAYCQKVINEIAESIKSVNDIKIQANQVFKYALKMEIIQKNPMEYVSIPRQQNELISEKINMDERNYWKKDEIKNFLTITKNELSYRDSLLFHLLIYTGARKGEILALTWDDIDFKSSSIRFSKTLFHNNGHFIFQTSKTRESRRLISIDDKSLSLLKKSGV